MPSALHRPAPFAHTSPRRALCVGMPFCEHESVVQSLLSLLSFRSMTSFSSPSSQSMRLQSPGTCNMKGPSGTCTSSHAPPSQIGSWQELEVGQSSGLSHWKPTSPPPSPCPVPETLTMPPLELVPPPGMPPPLLVPPCMVVPAWFSVPPVALPPLVLPPVPVIFPPELVPESPASPSSLALLKAPPPQAATHNTDTPTK